MTNLIIVDLKDNVATAVADIIEGTVLKLGGAESTASLTALQTIPSGHKIALVDMDIGNEVTKYGAVIGVATARIAAGDHVHVHNIASNRIRGDLNKGGAA